MVRQPTANAMAAKIYEERLSKHPHQRDALDETAMKVLHLYKLVVNEYEFLCQWSSYFDYYVLNAILRQSLLVAGDSNGAQFYLCNSSIVMLKTKKQVFVAVLALMIHLFVLVLQRYEDHHHM